MSEIRERLEEIQKLTRGFLSADVMAEIHEDATKALALLEEAEPVAWAVHFRRAAWTLDRVLFSEKQARERVAGWESQGYDARTTPLYTSPTPTQATRARVEELEELVGLLTKPRMGFGLTGQGEES